MSPILALDPRSHGCAIEDAQDGGSVRVEPCGGRGAGTDIESRPWKRTVATDSIDGPMTMPPGGLPNPPENPTDFQRAVIAIVLSLQPGDVATYAEVADEAGHPGSAQAVANVLRKVPDLPWWRVIPSSGRLYRTHRPTQEPLLRADGVAIDDTGRVAPRADRLR